MSEQRKYGPRKFTVWTGVKVALFVVIALITLPIWIIPSIMIARSTSD